jgi:predicted RNA-binding protein associated with RNAse of E/G family
MRAGIFPAEIVSGDFGDAEGVDDYRFERLGEILVERVIWGVSAAPLQRNDVLVAGPGYIWFRFWVLPHNQVLERYYGHQGQLIGMQIDLCMPPVGAESGWRAKDLLLDIWVTPEGRVTLSGEARFEQAVQQGRLSREEAAYADAHVRRLTTGIAQGSFPPPIVRRWQVDLSRIHETHPRRLKGDGSD